MKMEQVEAELKAWGELVVTTAAGDRFELHLGDTTFDTERRIITLKTPTSIFEIDGDSIEHAEKHYGHRVDA